MWSLLSGMLTPGSTEKVIDGAVNGIDKLFFTDEEKSDASAKILDWKLKYLDATKPQQVSRRFIAIVITLLWAVLVVAMLVAKALGADSYAEYAVTVMKDIVALPFSIILGFYFLAHLTRNIGASK